MPRVEPHNGRCVCEIHRQFEAANGYTVDQYYEMHPEREPWYLERCPNCPERQQQAQQVEPTQQPTPEPVVVKPVQQPEIVFVENPKQVLQESITEMCNTFIHRDARTGCDTCEGAINVSGQSALAGALVIGTICLLPLALLLPLAVIFGLSLLVTAPFVLALWFVWSRRSALWNAYLTLDAYLTDLFISMAVSAWRMMRPQRRHQHQPFMLPAEQQPTAPKLLGTVASEPIKITARPVEYARVKHG
ncbi:MAG: hypothetical protein U0350_02470 [Caldilineaceae bacterium]